MTNPFKTIISDAGKVALAVFHALVKADTAVDKTVPELEAVLEDGASVAKLVPGVSAEAVPLLNAGVSLLGATKAALDGTVALEPTVAAQVAALAPSGYSFLLVEQDVKSDAEALLKNYEVEFEVAKQAVATLASKGTTTQAS